MARQMHSSDTEVSPVETGKAIVAKLSAIHETVKGLTAINNPLNIADAGKANKPFR